MTIGGWAVFGIIALCIGGGCLMFALDMHDKKCSIGAAVVAVVLIVAVYGGLRWYFQNTASGQRALVDQKSELANGLERTITVYTADGNIIAEYTGNIDIEGNDGGYVLFDFDGKRYTYYNCFVESIAELD